MNQTLIQIAQHLELPKEMILTINDQSDPIVVLLTNYQKHKIPRHELPEPQTVVPTTELTPGIFTGLGRTSLDRLQEAGITTVAQMKEAGPEQIAAITKQRLDIVQGWLK